MNDLLASSQHITSTFSCAANDHPWLWKVLECKLPTGSWRAAISDKGILTSALRGEVDGKHRNHLLISSFFGEPTEEINLNEGPDYETESESDVEVEGHSELSLEELKLKSVKELRIICKENNIRPGRRLKRKLAEHIFTVLNNVNRQERSKEIENDLSHCFYEDALHHTFYRENFNAVNLHNRHWYSFIFCYG